MSKKSAALILALELCLSLCACGNASLEQAKNPPAIPTSQELATENSPALPTFQELAYELDSEEYLGSEGYIVCGVGNCTDSEIVIPSTYKGKPVTCISDNAFRECKWLTSVTIPDSVGYIGEYAFYNCSGLTSVTIPDSIGYIGSFSFSHCSGLTSITIPDNGKNIAIRDGAFEYCTGLTSVTISDSVTDIGFEAFKYCSGLTSVTIPDSVDFIGYRAFQYCDNLKEITFTGTREQWDSIRHGAYSAGIDLGTIIHCSDGDIIAN